MLSTPVVHCQFSFTLLLIEVLVILSKSLFYLFSVFQRWWECARWIIVGALTSLQANVLFNCRQWDQFVNRLQYKKYPNQYQLAAKDLRLEVDISVSPAPLVGQDGRAQGVRCWRDCLRCPRCRPGWWSFLVNSTISTTWTFKARRKTSVSYYISSGNMQLLGGHPRASFRSLAIVLGTLE